MGYIHIFMDVYMSECISRDDIGLSLNLKLTDLVKLADQ